MSATVRNTNAEDFDQVVVQRSFEVPVVVDFWAPWCGPCQVLGSLLEQEVSRLEGRAEMVKANTEENPTLSERFQIRSIPAVKVFRDGRIVDEFAGALPVPQIRAFLAKAIPSEAKEALEAAIEQMATKNYQDASNTFRALLEDDEVGSQACLHLADTLVALRDHLDEAEQAAKAIKPFSDEHPRQEDLLQLIAFLRDAKPGDIATLERVVAADPRDPDKRNQLAAARLAQGDTEGALRELLESVSRAASHDNARARRAMLAIFDHLSAPGGNPEMARTFRRRLQIVS